MDLITINLRQTDVADDDKGEFLAQEIKRLIDASFTRRLSLDELSSRLGFSPRTLRDVFRKKFGFSPSEYRMSLRIIEAKRLLELGIQIKQIVANVGFFDQSHLTRHFKRATGKTPAEYCFTSGWKLEIKQ